MTLGFRQSEILRIARDEGRVVVEERRRSRKKKELWERINGA